MLPPLRPLARLRIKRQMLAVAALVLAGLSQPLADIPSVESPGIDGQDFAFAVETKASDNGEAALAAIPLDYGVSDGHFFREAAPALTPLAGYTVSGPLWQVFQANGGTAALGYPVSQQWTDAGGNLRQAFERGILVVEVADGQLRSTRRADVLDDLRAADKWSCIEKSYGAPSASALPHSGEQAMLDRDPELRSAFLSRFDWRERFGLPVAIRVEADTVTLVAQRAIIQRWRVDSPSAAAGSIKIVDAPTLAAKCGMIPVQALQPSVSPAHGWLRVSGRQIIDGQGNAVRISGINWPGFELRDFAPRGLEVGDYAAIVDRVAELGFNTIRMPFSNEMVERNPLPDPRTIAACPTCRGKRALDLMDMIVDYAAAKGLRVILDNHFSAASDQAGSVLWYTKTYPHDAWLRDWQTMAQRYRDNPAVIGFDLRNEPRGPASWGSGDRATDWRLAAEEAGRAILTINPNVLIIVEGIEAFPKPGGGMDLTWWGGNLQGVRQFPVRLPAENLLYSPHDYGPSLYKQSWFNQDTSVETLNAIWHRYWAYLNLEMDLPLLVGEIGTGNATSDIVDVVPGSQGQWFQGIVALLRSRDNLHWMYWTVDALDQYALFDTEYEQLANPEKLTTLRPALGQRFRPLPPIRTQTDVVDPDYVYAFAAR